MLLTRGDEHWGLGHLHRVSWLAPALAAQDLIADTAVYCVDSPPARAFWRSRDSRASFLPATWLDGNYPRLAELVGEPSTVIIDWLDSPPPLVEALQDTNSSLVLLDDYGPAQDHAHLVINSLLADLAPAESIHGQAHLHSGVQYVQLPPAVTKLRGVAAATAKAMATELAGEPPRPGPVQAVMISFGGHEQPQLIELALKALAQTGYSGRVIVMPGQEALAPTFGLDVEMVPAGPQFHSLLAATDLAICGGGLSLYEAVFLGVPAIAIGVPSLIPGYEHHQHATAEKLAAAGCCRAAGMAGQVSPELLAAIVSELLDNPQARGMLSASGMKLLDGRGLMRTVALITQRLRY